MSPGASFCSQASWASPPWERQFTAPLERAPAEVCVHCPSLSCLGSVGSLTRCRG